MPFRHSLLFLLPLCYGAWCFGQSAPHGDRPFTVAFTDGYELPEGARQHGFSFLVPVRLKDGKFYFRDTSYTLTLPPRMDPDSAAIADVYFTGRPTSRHTSVAWYLLYPYQLPRPTLYIDTTDAFDFTAAPAFDYLPNDSAWITQVARQGDPDCTFRSQFEPPAYNDELKKADVEKYSGTGSLTAKNERVDADFWLR
ncbi:hypothetical protein CLV84_0196 [Neolewinella xylanilytica]|uniref:Uncharacterized protein n=1 Tax=Neolewinella xylanilytica TaxID=1514080 RepID=A0A2S6I704_9BACT|nr:hypothetical protein CLV84_0196 [Neolewinella xylanilytica]